MGSSITQSKINIGTRYEGDHIFFNNTYYDAQPAVSFAGTTTQALTRLPVNHVHIFNCMVTG